MEPAIVQTKQSMEDDLTNKLQNNEDSSWTLISAPICKIDEYDVPGSVISKWKFALDLVFDLEG